MLQIVLLAVAVVSLFRRDKVNALLVDQFAGVSVDKFEEWKSLRLQSIRIFLWATWGLFLINMAAAFLLSLITPASRVWVSMRLFTVSTSISGGSPTLQIVEVLFFIAFIVLLVMAARIRMKAARLRKSVGIKQPK